MPYCYFAISSSNWMRGEIFLTPGIEIGGYSGIFIGHALLLVFTFFLSC